MVLPAELERLTVQPARTVSFTVNDGTSDSATVTRQITVTAVNDAPVNTVPGAQTVNEDTDLTFSTVLPFGAEPVLQAR